MERKLRLRHDNELHSCDSTEGSQQHNQRDRDRALTSQHVSRVPPVSGGCVERPARKSALTFLLVTIRRLDATEGTCICSGHSSSTGSDAPCSAYGPSVVPPKTSRVTFPVQPVKPVTAVQLPVGKPGEWSYEPKFDGFRCISFRSGERVRLQSRQQRPLTQYFPEIAAAVGGLDVDLVLDGEVVLWHEARLDFAALQLRLHPAESRAHALARSMPASACPPTIPRSRPWRSPTTR